MAAMPAAAQQLDLRDYARARAADAAGDAAVAAAGYARALAVLPDDQVLAMRTYRQSIAAGDYALASRAAAALARDRVAPPDGDLLAFAVALHGKDRAGAEGALGRLAKGPFEFVVPSLRAWLADDRSADPQKLLDAARGNALASRFSDRQRVPLLIAAGQPDQGLLALAALGSASATDDSRIDAGIALLRAGQKDKAGPLLADLAGVTDAWRKRESKAGKPDAIFGASRVFLGLAGDLRSEDMVPLSILLGRATLLLDPQEDRARLLLGDALSRGGSTDLALATLAAVPSDSPFYRGAGAGQIAALRRADRLPEALARAETMARAPDANVAEIRQYGEILFESGRHADAAAAFARAIDRVGDDADWELNYMYGTALDQAGRWNEALPALRRAVQLAPEEPEALSYLGYAQVEHRMDLPGAQELLERARKLKPDDPGIIDSLGWAYFADGQTAKAVPLLEQAVRADPAGVRANEHLGDAYWALGRRIDARYAWRAAEVAAAGDELARLRDKLANGLD